MASGPALPHRGTASPPKLPAKSLDRVPRGHLKKVRFEFTVAFTTDLHSHAIAAIADRRFIGGVFLKEVSPLHRYRVALELNGNSANVPNAILLFLKELVVPMGCEEHEQSFKTEQGLVGRCRHIHAPQPEPVCNAGVNMFIKMKPNLHRPPCLKAFAVVAMEWLPLAPPPARRLPSFQPESRRDDPSST